MAAKVQLMDERDMELLIKEADFVAQEPKLIKVSDNLYVPEDFKTDHSYYADAEGKRRYYGITSILGVIAKPALIQWAANMMDEHIRANVAYAIPGEDGGFWAIKPSVIDEARFAHNKKKEKAGELGTLIHSILEGIINEAISKDGKITADMIGAEAHPQVREFVQWAMVNDVKFLASEQRLYSEKLWVAGTADFICQFPNGKLFIGDIKTSSGIYPEMFLQATAYAHMAREMGLYKDFKGVVIVNIPKRGGLQVKESYDLKGNFAAFKGALAVFKFKEGQKVKRIKK